MSDSPQNGERRMSRSLVWLLAVASGAAVANPYYAQPLLHEIAGTLHTSSATAALLVTASQIGYAAGLVLLVPLGDLRPEARSRLTTAYMIGNFLCGAAGSAGAGVVWSHAQWGGVCALGGALSLIALAVWVASRAGVITAAPADRRAQASSAS